MTRVEATRGHVPALDGVRGLAILLVMLYHHCVFTPRAGVDRAWAALCRCGWSGVDLFFVLSGFLITGILIDAKRPRDGAAPAPGRYFLNFYARRALRILPLYYAVLLAFFVVVPLIPAQGGYLARAVGEYREAAGHQLWFWLHGSNIYFALHGWIAHGIPAIFWSLSIEEQFYLAWPVLVWLAPARTLARSCLAIAVLALAFRMAMLHTPLGEWFVARFVTHAGAPLATAVYNLTPGRLDGLALGGFLATLVRAPDPGGARSGEARPARARRAVLCLGAASGIALLIGAVLTNGLDEYDRRVQGVGYSLLALAFGAVVLVAATAPAGSRLHAALAWKPLRVLGTYAYAMYLFHFPVRTILLAVGARPDRVPPVLGSGLAGQLAFHALALGVTLGLAWVSWRVIESPCLRLKRYFE